MSTVVTGDNQSEGERKTSLTHSGALRGVLLILITVLTVTGCSEGLPAPTIAEAYVNATEAAQSARVATEAAAAAATATPTIAPVQEHTLTPTPTWDIELGGLLAKHEYTCSIIRGKFQIKILVGVSIMDFTTNSERTINKTECTREVDGKVEIFDKDGNSIGVFVVWRLPGWNFADINDVEIVQ